MLRKPGKLRTDAQTLKRYVNPGTSATEIVYQVLAMPRSGKYNNSFCRRQALLHLGFNQASPGAPQSVGTLASSRLGGGPRDREGPSEKDARLLRIGFA